MNAQKQCACGAGLIDGKCSNRCDLSAQPTTTRVIKPIEYVDSDRVAGERERIAELKAEHPDNWRELLMAEVNTAAQRIKNRSKPEERRKIEYAKFRQELREAAPHYGDLSDVLRTMPAPSDKAGMLQYLQKLKGVQRSIPG